MRKQLQCHNNSGPLKILVRQTKFSLYTLQKIGPALETWSSGTTCYGAINWTSSVLFQFVLLLLKAINILSLIPMPSMQKIMPGDETNLYHT